MARLPPDRAAVVCGVDSCKTGWVVVWHELTSNRLWWDVVRTLPEIAAASPRTAVIAIDVPIGLLDAGARECDREARRRLGSPRSSSVFTAPLRPLLDAHDYAEASALRRRLEGKGLSRQAWGIVPKVREVDEALRADGELRQLVREVHPELCFAGMNGGRAMAARKKIAAGRTERVAVLRAQFGDVVDEALASKPSGCQADDLLDAFAPAWTAARVAHEQEEVIPTIVPRDDFGLPMEMAI